jgi:flavorubredoxin
MLPTVGGFLTYLKGLKPRNRIGFAFGSLGWGGGALAAIENEFKATGIEIAREAISARYIPDAQELMACFDAGKEFAELIKK